MSCEWENDGVVQRFREYLQIPSVHPNVDYRECVTFLQKQAELLDLPVKVYELVPEKPIVVISWIGTHPELPAILLNSHMDVVPVYEEFWTHPPFEAHISEDGYIYARGTQDMKSIGMLHLEAVRKLKEAGVMMKRTVHVSFVPDEEIGGIDGMRKFAESDEFKNLNIGFGLDESIPSENNKYIIAFHGEKTTRQIKITSRGVTGHGSLIPSNTAGEKLYYVIDKFMKLRAEQRRMLEGGAAYGEVISINLTKLSGGVQVNVLPESLTAYIDIRIAPHVDHDEFENMILSWCKEAGDNVTLEYIEKNPEVKSTKIDGSVPFLEVLNSTVKKMGLEVSYQICPGATDARFVRRQGIPVIGFSPLLNTPLLIHDHDERVHVDAYKRGIEIMEKVLLAIANV
ncbi:aminoacylase-1-like [Epargyreus clarus]|uniref:aminoacylase-1-like n=1 Tax=Epargyreus clarus TaxID=520877 RepID=UPI003C2AF4DD